MTNQPCGDCKNHVPTEASTCPHCGRPSLFPNIVIAKDEQDDLDQRYNAAIEDSRFRGVVSKVLDFESKLEKSRAIINRPLTDIQRLAGGDNEMYATYYQLASIRSPKGDEWDSRRQSADALFFTSFQREIRFASLSLDSTGLSRYGDCSLVLRDEMIAHRASVCDENTVFFVKKHQVFEANDIPKGYRSVWADRAKLCIAKLAKNIDNTTISDEYSELLCQNGVSDSDDEFVEVHIFGSMTVRTFEEVTFKPANNNADRAIIKGIKEKLAKFDVKVK